MARHENRWIRTYAPVARANDTKTAGAPMAGFGRFWPLLLHRRARMSRVQPSPGDRLDSWKEIAAWGHPRFVQLAEIARHRWEGFEA